MTNKYDQIKSNFIKEKIKKLKWSEDNRDYIGNLMFLEISILVGIGGMAGNMKLHELKSTYEKEYNKIFEELKPEDYKKYLKNKKEDTEQDKKDWEEFEKEEKEEEKQDKENWIKSGGKI